MVINATHNYLLLRLWLLKRYLEKLNFFCYVTLLVFQIGFDEIFIKACISIKFSIPLLSFTSIRINVYNFCETSNKKEAYDRIVITWITGVPSKKGRQPYNNDL